jgi:hypothetical protein
MLAVLVKLGTHVQGIVMVILAFLAPIKVMAAVILALVLIDVITGTYAAYKRGEKIQSAVMRRSIQKLLVYQCGLLAAFLVQYLAGITAIPIVNLVAALIGCTEFLSIFENLNSISGTNLFKGLIIAIGKKVKNLDVDNIDKKE